jgi:hypothetical protein
LEILLGGLALSGGPFEETILEAHFLSSIAVMTYSCFSTEEDSPWKGVNASEARQTPSRVLATAKIRELHVTPRMSANFHYSSLKLASETQR